MGRLLVALAALGLGTLGSFTALAQEDDAAIIPTTLDELLEAVGDTMEEHEVPAVGLALVDDSGPVWVGSLGKANLENDVDADADTLYRIGSTSKMFVALSVLQLVEEGKLSLDDKVADLAPEIEFENPWEDTHPVRLAHLLEHTTGWDDIHLPEYAHNDPTPVTLKDGLDYHPHSRKSRWQPGTRSSYCNAGPPVAAYIVEKVTGRDFEDYVRDNFFTPLQMSSATYRLSEGVKQKGATLYANGAAEEYWHIIMRPSGSINASPHDMSRFLQLFLGRGTVDGVQYISEKSLQRMETAHTTSGAIVGLEAGYGLNNYTSSHESWVYRAHNGGVTGGLTEFAYLPGANLGYAFMINSGSGAAFEDISELIRNYQTHNLPAPDVPDAVPLNDTDRGVAGLYHLANSRQQFSYFLDRLLAVEKLWFEDGQLKRKALLDSEVTTYVPAGNGLYRSPDTGMIVLARADDPLAGSVIHVGSRVLRPVSGLVAYGQLAIAALWGLSIVTSLLYVFVWGVRKLRGKVPAGPSTRIRVWPLLAGISMIGFFVLFAVGMSDVFNILGRPTPISIGVMLMTIAFAVCAVAASYTAYTSRSVEMNRINYWYCSISSYLHLLVAGYLLWFGVIGFQTWT